MMNDNQSPRFVGVSPTGRRFYVASRTGVPLVYAVFAKVKFGVMNPVLRWERVSVVEDRLYPNEKYRDPQLGPAGSYINSMDMDAARKAEEEALWYREVLGCEATVVRLVPAVQKVSKCG